MSKIQSSVQSKQSMDNNMNSLIVNNEALKDVNSLEPDDDHQDQQSFSSQKPKQMTRMNSQMFEPVIDEPEKNELLKAAKQAAVNKQHRGSMLVDNFQNKIIQENNDRSTYSMSTFGAACSSQIYQKNKSPLPKRLDHEVSYKDGG